jgi:ABC-2 type transport system permease protein/lipopolysaccharide transport system permease protein
VSPSPPEPLASADTALAHRGAGAGAEPDPSGEGPARDWALTLPDVPVAPPPEIRYRPNHHLKDAAGALVRSRGIIWSLTVRDLRSTYSQEVLGLAWALLSPFALMVVFTFLANRLGGVSTGGVWKPLFFYVGLLPWTFFANALSGGGTSLVANPLLNKVYAPREVFPIAKILSAIVTLLCASLALAVLFALDGTWPSGTSYWAPLLLLLLFVFTVGVTLFVAGVTVYLRDMRHALPLVLQLGLFFSPILFGLEEIPRQWRGVYVAVNPVGGVIDGLRRCLLYDQAPQLTYTLIAAGVALAWLFGAFMLFKRLETGFADVS